MQLQEFIDRTGWHDTAEEAYSRTIEPIYLNTGEMSKDEFCADFKKHHGSAIIGALHQKCEDQRGHISRLDRHIKMLEDERKEIVDFLISMYDQTENTILRDQAIEMVGRKEYILRKCHMALPLDDLEQAWIIELLEDKK